MPYARAIVALRSSPFGHGRSEAFERRGHTSLLRRERRVLAENVRSLRSLRGWTQVDVAEAAGLHPVHVSRIELGAASPALPTIVALALAFGVRVHTLFAEGAAHDEPFESSTAPEAIPLYDLAAAAGTFGEARAVEPIDQVIVRGGFVTRPGMFVARVVGGSMEPLIPSGSYCVFASTSGRMIDGRVVLAQLREDSDPETGGAYTVKRLRLAAGGRVRLIPENAEYPTLAPGRRQDIRVVAELMWVLGRRTGPQRRNAR